MDSSRALRRVRTLDDAIQVFQDRDFDSAVISRVRQGVELQLGATSQVFRREWVEATLPDGICGFVLGATARSHTTATCSGDPLQESPALSGLPNFTLPEHNVAENPHEGIDLAKTIRDLIVTAFVIVTSSVTALILALVESNSGFAFYSLMLWFVIPAGALLSGFAAASGYYFGAKLFHHRPTRLLAFNMTSVAVTTYFLLNWLNYSFMQVEGRQVANLIPFGHYMDIVLTHQSMEFSIRGARLGETGQLGIFGYVTALLQVLAFAVGGLCVYAYLRAAPYCGACGNYLKEQSSITRYTSDAQRLPEFYCGLVTLLQLQGGDSAAAAQLLSGFGTPATNVKDMKLNAALKLWKCMTCPQEFIELSANRWNGRDWKPISGLHHRDYLSGG